MHIDHLAYLVAAVDLGSMAEAAHHLHVTSQAISKAIKDMEKYFGHEIITRDGRSIKPTALGTELADLARPVVEGYKDFEAFGLSYIKDGDSPRTIRLGIPVTALRGALFDESRLDLFRFEFPEISLKLFHSSADGCLRALEQGLVDVAISVGRCSQDDFFNIRVGSLQLKVLARAGHPAALGEAIDFNDLARFPIALPEDLRFVFPKIDQQFTQTGQSNRFEALTPTLEAHKTFLAKDGLILAGQKSPLLELGDFLCEKPLAVGEGIFALPLYLTYPQSKNHLSLSRLQSTLIRGRGSQESLPANRSHL